jgi:hypothetical protein
MLMRVDPLLITAALFILLTLWLGGQKGFCMDAALHETIRQTTILSLRTADNGGARFAAIRVQ